MRIDISRVRHMGAAFIARYRRAELYRAVFDSPDGKLVLADLLERANALSTTMVAGDPHMSAFQEGKRALALEILEILRWNALDVIELSQAREAPYSLAESDAG